MSDWQPIDTAPKDGSEFLLIASWDWDGMYGEECNDPPSARVAFWREDGRFDDDGEPVGVYVSSTSNPYTDHAVRPTHWMPIPQPPK